MTDCNPSDYVKWDSLKDHCGDKHAADMMWAKTVVEESKKDRSEIKERVSKIEAFKDKFLWLFLVASLGIIATNLIGPRLMPHDSGVRELKGYIAEVAGELKDQKQLIEVGNKISLENQEKLKVVNKKLKLTD